MRSPRVSVVVPTRDRSALLRRAVTSILNQTFHDLEVIVVDDGSADESARRVAEIDARIRYARHEFPRAECAARNTGIRLARGRYLAFLDDDDEWMLEKLERQVRILDSSPPDVGVVYTAVETRWSDGSISVDHASAGGDIYELLFEDPRGSHASFPVNNISMLVRRECFVESGLFDEDLVYGVAWDMHVRLAKRWKFVPIRDPLVIIHRGRAGVSQDPGRVIEGLRRLLRKHWTEIEARPRCHSLFHLMLGVLELNRGNYSQSRNDLARAISARPWNVRALGYFLLSYQPRIVRDGFLSVWRKARLRWQGLAQ